ncbi:MAG: hypothetical protein QMD05_09755, partial [Candidatus Brocadiaceae bacterium]|nr:hypothetical protein [Candidatus Brocadiaceae bacterium]
LALCSSYRTGATAWREGEAGAETQTLSGAMVAEAMGLKAGHPPQADRLNVNPVQVSGMAHGVAISIGDRVRSLDMSGRGNS